MSLMKLMPLAAIGIAGAVGASALKKNADVVDKFQIAATQSVELKGIAQAVAMDYTESHTLPVGNFADFLRENMRTADGQPPKRDPSLDPWDTPYQLVQIHNGFQVRSAGPDKNWATDDDLVHPYDLSGISDVPPVGGRKPAVSKAAPGAGQPQVRQRSQPRRQRSSKEETEQRVIAFQRKQAEKGSARAQFALAERYLYGEGVEYDPQTGMKWLRKAADNGSREAVAKLKSMDNEFGIAF